MALPGVIGVKDLRVAILASGGGSNMQAIVDAFESGRLRGGVVLLISNNSASGAMRRARDHGIPRLHLSTVTHPDPDDRDRVMERALRSHGAELVCLAGYMKKIGPRTLKAYRGRILNIHPALLPRHGGQGMYGERVHRSVLASGDKKTGATVHLVDEEYDQGPVLAQVETQVLPHDDPESLANRVLPLEHRLYVDVLEAISRGDIPLSSFGQRE